MLSYGWLGMHGMFYANMAADNADLVIGIGMRFDDRAMGRFKDFNPNAKIIHIDIDPAEIGKNFPTAVPIVGDAKNVLPRLAAEVDETEHPHWIRWIDKMREEHPSLDIRESRRMLPQYVMRTLYEADQRRRDDRRPASGSTRCGPDSTTTTSGPASSSRPADWARWASNCRRRLARRWHYRDKKSGPSAETAASR